MTIQDQLQAEQDQFATDIIEFAIFGLQNLKQPDFWDIYYEKLKEISLKYKHFGEYGTLKIVEVVREIEVRYEKELQNNDRI